MTLVVLVLVSQGRYWKGFLWNIVFHKRRLFSLLADQALWYNIPAQWPTWLMLGVPECFIHLLIEVDWFAKVRRCAEAFKTRPPSFLCLTLVRRKSQVGISAHVSISLLRFFFVFPCRCEESVVRIFPQPDPWSWQRRCRVMESSGRVHVYFTRIYCGQEMSLLFTCLLTQVLVIGPCPVPVQFSCHWEPDCKLPQSMSVFLFPRGVSVKY